MTPFATVRSILLAITIAAGTITAQVLPVKLYGGARSERAYALVQGSDQGFCLAGWTTSFGPGTPNASNVIVTKTDAAGVPLWSRMSVGTNTDEAYSMVRTSDNGYAITGWTRSYGPGTPNKNIFAIKLDPAGNQIWGWVYGGMQDEEAYSIIETRDSGFAITGWTASFGAQPMPNAFVLRLNRQGWPVWFRTYWGIPMHMEDEGHSIVETPDLGFAVAGRMKATTPNNYDPFLLKVDPMGRVQWAEIVPGVTDQEDGWSVALDVSGKLVVSGWTRSFGTNPGVSADAFVARFGLDGSLLWSSTFGWLRGDEQVLDDRSLVATSDGGSAISGLTTSVGPGIPNPNFLILKLNQNGQPMWCRSHPSPYWPGLQTDVGLPIIEQPGGGYAVAGYSDSYNLLGNGDDMVLSTFDLMGNRPVCTESQEPEVESLPWHEWQMVDSAYYISEDTMRLVPVVVRHDSVCYDTTSMGAEEMNHDQTWTMQRNGGELGLRVVRGMVELNIVRSGQLSVELLSISGRQVATLAQGDFTAGRHELGLPLNLAAGLYLVRAQAEGTAATTKAIIY